jgi:hypothetical protein
MAYNDMAYSHIFARDENASSVYGMTDSDTDVQISWTASTSYAYRGAACTIDRMRGIAYYGQGAGTNSGNSISMFQLNDGTYLAGSTSTTYDNYSAVFAHPNGTVFYVDQASSSPSNNLYKINYNGAFNATALNVDDGRTVLYPTDVAPDVYERPDRKIIVSCIDSSTYWNTSTDTPGTIYIRQYDFITNTTVTLFSFDIDTYSADDVRIRLMKMWATPDGHIIIAVGAATSQDGGFYAKFQRNGSNVWYIGAPTVNSDIRNSQYANIDTLNYRWLYIGSGSTNDPEVVGQIDLNDGSINDFVKSHSAQTGNEHRTNSTAPILHGRLWSDNTDMPGGGVGCGGIFFGGYGGNHNPTPNIAKFDGNPLTEFDETNAGDVIRHGTTSKQCHVQADANGAMQAACLAGAINPSGLTVEGGLIKGLKVRMHSYADDIDLIGVDDYVLETYGGDMVRQMRHGKFWFNGVQIGMAGS